MLCREDQGNARFMTCAYHGWSFSTSGDLVSMPGDTAYGPDFERPGLAKPAQVDSYRGFVFVTFNPSGPFDGSFTALPVQIFNYVTRPQDDFRVLAAAGIILLLVVLLIVNSFAIWLRNRYQRKW